MNTHINNAQPGLYIQQAELLLPRLERIAPDSSWAHRATGLRRTLLRLIQSPEPNPNLLEAAVRTGFFVLESAAKDKFR